MVIYIIYDNQPKICLNALDLKTFAIKLLIQYGRMAVKFFCIQQTPICITKLQHAAANFFIDLLVGKLFTNNTILVVQGLGGHFVFNSACRPIPPFMLYSADGQISHCANCILTAGPSSCQNSQTIASPEQMREALKNLTLYSQLYCTFQLLF